MEDLDVSLCARLHARVLGGRNRSSVLMFVLCLFVQISVSLNKDEPETPLANLMKTKGAEKVREALGSYVGFLKTGE